MITLSRYMFDDTCLLVVIIIILYNTHMRGHSPYHTRMRGTKDGRSKGTVIACIETDLPYTLHPPIIHTCTRRKSRRRIAIVVNDWGFFYATSSDGIYTGCPSHLSLATVHQLLSVRCSTPRDARTKRQHNTQRELYGGLIMLTSRTTTPPPLLSPNGYTGT